MPIVIEEIVPEVTEDETEVEPIVDPVADEPTDPADEPIVPADGEESLLPVEPLVNEESFETPSE